MFSEAQGEFVNIGKITGLLLESHKLNSLSSVSKEYSFNSDYEVFKLLIIQSSKI